MRFQTVTQKIPHKEKVMCEWSPRAWDEKLTKSNRLYRYSDLESRMKDELMNVKIKFTEQSQTVAELKQEISRLETKVYNQLF